MSDAGPPQWTTGELQARLLRPPFNAWLELRLLSWGDEGVVIGLDARPELLGHTGVGSLHGGVLATLVDVAASFAVIVRTGESLLTVDMRVDYHRPATATGYRAEARVVRLGRTLATADTQVLAVDRSLVASGRAVFQHFPRPPA